MMSAGNRPSHIKTVWRGWQRSGERAGEGLRPARVWLQWPKLGRWAGELLGAESSLGFPSFFLPGF